MQRPEECLDTHWWSDHLRFRPHQGPTWNPRPPHAGVKKEMYPSRR